MMYGLHEKYDGNAVCTVVCMSRKKNSKSTGHHNFFLLTFCQKKRTLMLLTAALRYARIGWITILEFLDVMVKIS